MSSLHICVVIPNPCLPAGRGAIKDFLPEISGKGELEGEQMAALHHRLSWEVIGGRKVRAPQGRVVRNTDCAVFQETG